VRATTRFLDTNVVLYAAGAPHPHREPCAQVLRRAGAGDLALVVDTEVLQEILHVCARRGRRREGIALVHATIDLCVEVLPVTAADMVEACRLLEALEGLPVRDAVHAAVMLGHGVQEVSSVDRDFDRVPGVRRVPPGGEAEAGAEPG
jgi:uncharacterized protein